MSKYTPVPDHPEYEQHVDGRVRKTSNRHPVSDVFILEDVGAIEQSQGFEYWVLACCGRPWFATDWWGARQHQVLCLQTMQAAPPGSSPGRCTTRKAGNAGKMRSHVGPNSDWGTHKEDIPLLGTNVPQADFVPYTEEPTPAKDGPDRLSRRTDGIPRQRFVPVDGELMVVKPEGWKSGDPLTQCLTEAQMRAFFYHKYVEPSSTRRGLQCAPITTSTPTAIAAAATVNAMTGTGGDGV